MSQAPASGSKPRKVIDDKNLLGTVTYVDEERAMVEVKHPKLGELEIRLTELGILRKSTGFKDLVDNMDDFLSVSDEVAVDIKQRDKLWCASYIWLCPSPRPDRYGKVNDYFRRKHPVNWPEPGHCHVPTRRTGEVVSIMASVLRWSRVSVDQFLNIVEKFYVCEDLGGVFETYVKTGKALMSFVRTVPQYFFIDHCLRVCIHEGFTRKEFETSIASRCSEIPKKSRQYCLDDVRIICDVQEAFAVLQPMLDRAKERSSEGHDPGLVVALDCEGVNLGKGGQLTLVQLSTMDGQVYLFDVLQVPRLFEDGLLAELLESDAVLKVIHDCRNDAAALYHEFQITLTNVFDTSVAYRVLQDQCMVAERKPRIKLESICKMVGEKVKHKTKEFHHKIIKQIWAKRPLSDEMITYAASDVILLVPNLYQVFDRLIHPNWKNAFKLQCEDTIREHTQDDSSKEQTD